MNFRGFHKYPGEKKYPGVHSFSPCGFKIRDAPCSISAPQHVLLTAVNRCCVMLCCHCGDSHDSVQVALQPSRKRTLKKANKFLMPLIY